MLADGQLSSRRAASKQLIWCTHPSMSTEKGFSHHRGYGLTAQLGKLPKAKPASGADVGSAVTAETLLFVITDVAVYAAAVTMPVKS